MHPISLPHDHGEAMEKHMESIPKTVLFEMAADTFKLLGDSSRIRIFWILCHCEECVINLSAMVQMSSPAVSHHLKMLKASRLIVSRREGKEVYYKAADTQQAALLHQMIEALLEISCPLRECRNKEETGGQPHALSEDRDSKAWKRSVEPFVRISV